ncbi:LL-diaminopimelate aminotransferase [Elusimicrobiota bacterium]
MNETAARLKALPPYLFIEVDKMKQQAIEEGVDVINLGIGDPDIPTPELIKTEMKKALDDHENHQYPLGKGKRVFREQIRSFMKERYSIELDVETEIHPLIGSKEGIGHFPLAFINPGDEVLIPEPAYPVYNSGTIFAGGIPRFFALKEENGYLPDWGDIPEETLKKAKVIFLNYPNNPTGVMADREFFTLAVEVAKKYDIIIAHDAAYNEMYYRDLPISILQIAGAADVAIEFHSLSKTFSMTGWRIGWACGNADLIKGLATVKDNLDSGVFGAIQDAGSIALKSYEELVGELRPVYQERLITMAEGLKSYGWKMNDPLATFYLWTKPPVDISAMDAVKKIITQAGIICTPGSGFGPSGEGYIRFALTRDINIIKEALDRLKVIDWNKE